MKMSVFYKNLSVEEKFELMNLLEKEGILAKDEGDIIMNWISAHHDQLSGKLRMALTDFYCRGYELIDEIERYDFLHQRNIGMKSWNEFVALRGY